ncbi:Transcription termination protein NusB [hydrothermal vent metagenome]|uniref:Transcription termination protein NusB n=1 Tax=hydrothermal vent metagenome TaxID=652676 RepID=A0A3B0ZZ45_9ZZZZ
MSNKRSRARRYVVQALYQWQLSGLDIDDIKKQFYEEHNFKKIDAAFFDEVIFKVPSLVTELESKIVPYLSRSYSDIDPIEKGILLLGCYELSYRPDVPYRAVINEAIELAKTFGADDAHKFINGVLDKIALSEREVEVKTRAKKSS